MIGLGLVANIVTIVIGTFMGHLIGDRLRASTRLIVTDVLGLVTLLIAADSIVAVFDADLIAVVGSSAPLLIVLGSLLIGGILGSLLRLEERIEQFGGVLQRRLASNDSSGPERQRFIEGFVTSSLVFSVGPLAVLGGLNEGLGNGSEQLLLKSTLDGFASLAFAASFGIGVAFSVIPVTLVQGLFVLLGLVIGDVIPPAYLAAMTATGGLMLLGVSLRLLDIRRIAVADLLPALVVSPLLVFLVAQVVG